MVLTRWLAPGLEQKRWWFWGVLSAPLLTPPLLTAYAYTKPFLYLVRYPVAEEAAYQALIFCRVFPLAILAQQLLPRRMSAEALHAYALLAKDGAPWRFRWRHLEPATVIGALLVFLYAFHEFEMASLLQRPAWTVAIFDAQAQGYALGATWARLAGLVILQGGFILLIWHWLRRAPKGDAGKARPFTSRRSVAYAFFASAIITFIPIGLVGSEAFHGLHRLPQAFSMHAEVRQSLLVAAVAATLTYLLARRWTVRFRLWGYLLVSAGLLGSLLLSLSLLAIVPTGLRERPLPLVLGLTCLLFPIISALLALARQRERSESAWCGRLSGRSIAYWSTYRAPHLAVWATGFALAYFEVTVSAILAPTSMTPVMVRLYNLMHYGRDTMLSAYVVVIVAVPFLLLGLVTVLGYFLTTTRLAR